MLFGISLEGRDDGGESGKQKQSFQVFRYFLSFFFFKDSFLEEKNRMMGTKVFSHGYNGKMTYREEGISTNPLIIVPSMKRENAIFSPAAYYQNTLCLCKDVLR